MTIEFELALLGGVLVNNAVAADLPPMQADEFAEQFIGIAFVEVLKRIREGRSATPLTIKPWAEKWAETHDLDFNVAEFITGVVTNHTVMIRDFRELCEYIKDSARKRKIEVALNDIARRFHSEEFADDILADALQKLSGIAEQSGSAKAKSSREVAEDVKELIYNRGKLDSTGLAKLDQAMAGGCSQASPTASGAEKNRQDGIRGDAGA